MKAYYFWEKDTEAKFQSSFQSLYFFARDNLAEGQKERVLSLVT